MGCHLFGDEIARGKKPTESLWTRSNDCLVRSRSARGYTYLSFGATVETLNKLEQKLKLLFPDLEIAGKHAPPYFELDDSSFELQLDEDIELISKSGAKVVFVALGCPKQEFWMSQAQHRLTAVMIGVGAAFDFHSGQVSQAPRWMMAIGLEWLYRFSQEPRRLWQRYLINNPCFVILFGMQHLRRIFQSPKLEATRSVASSF